MKKLIKDALILFLITLVAGAALGAVYAITKQPIADAQLAARAAAYTEIFPDAANFATDDTLADALKNADALLKDAGFDTVSVSDALYVTDAAGARIGCVMTLSGKGYGGAIELTLGVTAKNTISGIAILSQSETAGLGAKCTEESFYGQFAGKTAAPLTVVKTGAAGDTEIDAISGATVTSKGITEAVNAGIWFAQHPMGGAGA